VRIVEASEAQLSPFGDSGNPLPSTWHPTPFAQFIVKIASRCNLACDYCYVYEMADQSWRQKPRQISLDIVELAANRIREHVIRHRVKEISIVLHGGEPLLVGSDYLAKIISQFRTVLDEVTKVGFAIQSNGLLLTEDILEIALEQDIRIGISLDGDRVANVHRTSPRGLSSYDAVRSALVLLGSEHYRACFGGILCTIDVQNDPIGVYDHLVSFRPPTLDFLLPHGNWENPPPGKSPVSNSAYAEWLIPIFDAWYSSPTASRSSIRLFEDSIHLLLGGKSSFEVLGLAPVNLVVIETDGSLEGVDTLKSAFEGAPATNLTLSDASFDDVLRHPMIVERQIGEAALHDQCLACRYKTVCGGGYFPHRYGAGTFKNPTVYCTDMMALLSHIESVLTESLQQYSASRLPPA
jgi:uncharacterized protein